MKKIYILALALGAFSISSYAQTELTDDFESYDLGDISSQSDHWRTWSGVDGGAEDGDVNDDEALSGSQSLHIDGSTITDQIMLVPSEPTTGIYTLQWYSLIPAGQSGYFNMQAALTPEGTTWTQALMGGNVYFNCDGSTPGTGGVTGVIDCSTFDQSFAYPEDEWFKVTCVYDLDAQSWSMSINDIPYVVAYPFAFGTQVFEVLAGLDFYSASATNDFYIDNVTQAAGVLATNDFATDLFAVYPNPVGDILNIKTSSPVDAVAVYDILGKAVIHQNPGTVSPTVNMSGLSAGVYMVKVTIGNASKTVKVIK